MTGRSQPQADVASSHDFKAAGAHIIRHMAMDRSYVLYKDVPQERYRQIAAKTEESPYHLQFFVVIWEGAILEVQPFDTKSTVVQLVLCATRSEAIAKVEEERESSLQSGWHDYDDSV
jgi:hypothetical protein